MGLAAGFTHLDHFVVECLPVACQGMAARNNDIDLGGSGGDTFANFLNAQVER